MMFKGKLSLAPMNRPSVVRTQHRQPAGRLGALQVSRRPPQSMAPQTRYSSPTTSSSPASNQEICPPLGLGNCLLVTDERVNGSQRGWDRESILDIRMILPPFLCWQGGNLLKVSFTLLEICRLKQRRDRQWPNEVENPHNGLPALLVLNYKFFITVV